MAKKERRDIDFGDFGEFEEFDKRKRPSSSEEPEAEQPRLPRSEKDLGGLSDDLDIDKRPQPEATPKEVPRASGKGFGDLSDDISMQLSLIHI